MKKQEYVSPEMEIVEMKMRCTILNASTNDAGGKGSGLPGNAGDDD